VVRVLPESPENARTSPRSGPEGRAVAFTDVFAELGLRHSGSTDVNLEVLVAATKQNPALAVALARAVVGVLGAMVALSDPRCIVIGGPWAGAAQVLDVIRSDFTRHPRAVPVHPPAAVEEHPSRGHARKHLRSSAPPS